MLLVSVINSITIYNDILETGYLIIHIRQLLNKQTTCNMFVMLMIKLYTKVIRLVRDWYKVIIHQMYL